MRLKSKEIPLEPAAGLYILLKQKTWDVPRKGVCLLSGALWLKEGAPAINGSPFASVHISLLYSTLLVLWNLPAFTYNLMIENYFGKDGSGALSP